MNDGAGPRATVYLAVALAAAAGGLVRLALAATLPDGVWPWATLLANALGCLAIGGYWRVAGPRGRWARSPVGRTAVMTGF